MRILLSALILTGFISGAAGVLIALFQDHRYFVPGAVFWAASIIAMAITLKK